MKKQTGLFVSFLLILNVTLNASGENNRDSMRSYEPGRDSSLSVRKITNVRERFEEKNKRNYLDYIQNQNASAQTGNFWIDGTGVVNGGMLIATSTNYSGHKLQVNGATLLQSGSALFFAPPSDIDSRVGMLSSLDNATFEVRGINTINITKQKGGGKIVFGGFSWADNSREEYARFASTGNLLIGSTTDAGYKLDINGSFRSKITNGSVLSFSGVQGTMELAADGTNTNTYFAVKGSSYAQFIVRSNSGMEGRMYHSGGNGLMIDGMNTNATNAITLQTPIIAPTAGTFAGVTIKSNTGSSTFYPSSGTAQYQAFSIQPLYNQTGTANGNIYGIYYNPTVTSVLGKHYGLYINSGANYFAGNLLIGTTTDAGYKLDVNGTVRAGTANLISGYAFAPNQAGIFDGEVLATALRIGFGAPQNVLLAVNGPYNIGAFNYTSQLSGYTKLQQVQNEITDPDRILVWSNDNRISYMTKSQLGIGASSSSNAWSLTGNPTTTTNDFIGTALGNSHPLVFKTNGSEAMRISADGKIGVGVININDGNYKLYVESGIRTRKVRVDQASWADYVFDPAYKLPSLKEVEEYVKEHKHLPDVPSEKEVQQNGLNLGDNQAVLLKKIEELTLYILEINKKVDQLSEENRELKKKLTP